MSRSGAVFETLHAAGSGLPLWLALQCLAVVLAFACFWQRSRNGGERLRLCLFLSFGGALLGASLFGVLVRLPAWVASGFQWSTLRGGVVAYGALAGLAASFAGLARLRGFSASAALDRLAPCFALLVVSGRLGCFFAGCDFGVVSHVPWAVRFPAPGPAFTDHLARGLVLASDRRSLPVHPTQLYEVALGGAIALVALATSRRSSRPGAAFWAASTFYAGGRLALDYLRGDTAGATWGPWTPSQWFSAMVLAVAAAWALSANRDAAPATVPDIDEGATKEL